MHFKNLLESLEKSFGKPFETFFAKSICRKLHSGESAFINPQGQLLSPRFFLKKLGLNKTCFFESCFEFYAWGPWPLVDQMKSLKHCILMSSPFLTCACPFLHFRLTRVGNSPGAARRFNFFAELC